MVLLRIFSVFIVDVVLSVTFATDVVLSLAFAIDVKSNVLNSA
jgi:hypothetical protein